MRRNHSRLLVAALALSLLAACSTAKDTGANPVKAGAGVVTPSTASSPGVAADPATNGASEIGIDQPDLSKVMFSKQFDLPGEPGRKVTVGILSLERKDKVAILKVVVTPQFADQPSELVTFKKALNTHPLWWSPTMLDLTNLKRYKVLGGSGGSLDYSDGAALSGQPIYAWAVFAAPPPDVTKVDLTLVDWMPRLTNVPIR